MYSPRLTICFTAEGVKCLYEPAPKKDGISPGVLFILEIRYSSECKSNSERGFGRFNSGSTNFVGISLNRSFSEETPRVFNISTLSESVLGLYGDTNLFNQLNPFYASSFNIDSYSFEFIKLSNSLLVLICIFAIHPFSYGLLFICSGLSANCELVSTIVPDTGE